MPQISLHIFSCVLYLWFTCFSFSPCTHICASMWRCIISSDSSILPHTAAFSQHCQDFCIHKTWSLGWRWSGHSAARCQKGVSLEKGTKQCTSTKPGKQWVNKHLLDQHRKSVFNRRGLSQGNEDRSTLQKKANGGTKSRGGRKKPKRREEVVIN